MTSNTTAAAATTTTTTAATIVVWVAGPPERGTWGLVWGCLVAIFASTWTVLHLNVPALEDGAWTRTVRKAKWMAITVLFPEFILAKAICELRLALADLRELAARYASPEAARWLSWVEESQESIDDPVVRMRWSWSVGYDGRVVRLLSWLLGLSAPAGGPARKQRDEEGATSEPGKSVKSEPAVDFEKRQVWTLTHSYLANMGGLVYVSSRSARARREQVAVYLPATGQILATGSGSPFELLRGVILDEDDIKDKSKADWLGRGLAVVQTTWIILNVASRAATELPLTQLEIATVAFSVFAIATYLANWWKPKDVSRPHIIPRPSHVSFQLRADMYDRMQSFMLRFWSPVEAKQKSEPITALFEGRVANDQIWMEGDTPLMLSLVAAGSLVFGGLHCLAWNFDFPSRCELVAWRIAAPITALLPVVILVISVYLSRRVNRLVETETMTSFMAPLKVLEQMPEEWWLEMGLRIPRTWRRRGNSIQDTAPADCMPRPAKEPQRDLLSNSLWHFYTIWNRFQKGEHGRAMRQQLVTFTQHIASFRSTDSSLTDLLETRQDQARAKLSTPDKLIPAFSLIDCCNQALKAGADGRRRGQLLSRPYHKASRYLTIGAGIVYAAARLTIIALLFTTLRSVPEGVHTDTPWTRFLPNIS